MLPDHAVIELDDRPLILATDGFWADMDTDRQTTFVDGDRQSDGGEPDDRGVLSISRKSRLAGSRLPTVSPPKPLCENDVKRAIRHFSLSARVDTRSAQRKLEHGARRPLPLRAERSWLFTANEIEC